MTREKEDWSVYDTDSENSKSILDIITIGNVLDSHYYQEFYQAVVEGEKRYEANLVKFYAALDWRDTTINNLIDSERGN